MLAAPTPLRGPACHIGSHRVTCHPSEVASPTLTLAVSGWYSIYPPIKDERLSRPEPTQVNDLPKVPAIPGVSWLSQLSAPLDTEGVNNLPTVVTQ